MTATRTKEEARSRRRARKETRKDPFALNQLHREEVINTLPLIDCIPEEAVDAIENASLKVLEEIGMEILHPPAVELLKQEGAKPSKNDEKRLCFSREFILEKVSLARSSFTIKGREPSQSMKIGGRNIVFLPVGSAPNASDLDDGRRPGNFQDYIKFVKLNQYFNCLHSFNGYSVEPQDIHPSIRHLRCLREQLVLGNKPVKGYSLGKARLEDVFSMIKIAHGVSDEEMMECPRMWTTINTNSPLKLDDPMAGGIMFMAEKNQVSVITPFTLAGAMAPATISGALVMQNAEFLVGAALAQCVRPGAPIVYGSFTSNVDLRSGSPAFGTPENVKASQVSGQLARRYNLPLRLSIATASNIADAQAASESVMSLWGCLTANANVVYHSTGWLEGGLCASFEKFVMDASMIDAIISYLRPLKYDEEHLALDAIREVGVGGHFFGAAHTIDRYKEAFHEPFASDWSNFGLWTERGSKDMLTRSNEIYHKIIENFEPPPIDDGIKEELDQFVNRRISEGGVKTDF